MDLNISSNSTPTAYVHLRVTDLLGNICVMESSGFVVSKDLTLVVSL